MTPSARLSAAISVLDDILSGESAERTLTRWARNNRYAGSKDRAAVRDVVFDCLRRQRSLAHHAGAMSGRALVMAHQDLAGEPLDELFNGEKFAPEEISEAEREALGHPQNEATLPEALDFPDFLLPELMRSLGDDLPAIMEAMQERAPVDLRVNALKTTVPEAQQRLAKDLIFTEPHPLSKHALRITQNPRKLASSWAYSYGFVELQDVSSQAVSEFCQAKPGMRVLDYCAGGGGKTLALAAQMGGKGELVAHDKNFQRMNSLTDRASRSGAVVKLARTEDLPALGLFDLVLVDAPCSGTGAWRRNPDNKWRLDAASLKSVIALQKQILKTASAFVKPGGTLVYATCSLLRAENEDVVAAFVEACPEWVMNGKLNLSPLQGGDGFFACKLLRE